MCSGEYAQHIATVSPTIAVTLTHARSIFCCRGLLSQTVPQEDRAQHLRRQTAHHLHAATDVRLRPGGIGQLDGGRPHCRAQFAINCKLSLCVCARASVDAGRTQTAIHIRLQICYHSNTVIYNTRSANDVLLQISCVERAV